MMIATVMVVVVDYCYSSLMNCAVDDDDLDDLDDENGSGDGDDDSDVHEYYPHCHLHHAHHGLLLYWMSPHLMLLLLLYSRSSNDYHDD